MQGGQAANPRTGELLDAIQATEANEVLLLPNNPNVVLAARQVASMTERPVVVVPTRNAAEGFAALLALDPGLGCRQRRADDRGRPGDPDAGRDRGGPGRDDLGKKVKKGQTIALDPDDGLVAVDGDADSAVLRRSRALDARLRAAHPVLRRWCHLAEAEAMARRIARRPRGSRSWCRHGGQPYYRYLIAAE